LYFNIFNILHLIYLIFYIIYFLLTKIRVFVVVDNGRMVKGHSESDEFSDYYEYNIYFIYMLF
jgi:hypothetical protein